MADWTNISNANVEPDAPWISATAFALRDNPIAIAEGATGAPRVQSDTAINWQGFGTGQANARDWVLSKISGTPTNAVGAYAFLVMVSGFVGTIQNGQTSAGSNLALSHVTASSTASDIVLSSSAGGMSGTWKNMGAACEANDATLWLRIS